MEKLKLEHPEVALALHEFVIRTIAARVGFANKEVAEFNRA